MGQKESKVPAPAPIPDDINLDFIAGGPKNGNFGTSVEEIPLQFSLQDQSNTHFCSAALIQPLLLLVAAHCVLGKRLGGIKAVTGADQRGLRNGTDEIRSISKIIIHPNYDNVSWDNDIALLVLDSPLPQSLGDIRMAKIPDGTWTVPEQATLTGWDLESRTATVNAKPGALKSVEVPLFNSADCRELYEVNTNSTVTNNMLCGGFAGDDSCKEIESGALLMCENGGASKEPYVCGIGSWGLNCESDPLPMVYTDVSKYHQWISNHISTLKLR